MKKFLAVLLTVAAIFSAAQIVEPVTAYAKDFWVASDDRCDYYVQTKYFQKYTTGNGRKFSIGVKIIWHDNGNWDSYRWDFFFDDAQNGWMCSNETTGRPFPVRKYLFTQRILDYCLENLY